jgi:hypothetical protein
MKLKIVKSHMYKIKYNKYFTKVKLLIGGSDAGGGCAGGGGDDILQSIYSKLNDIDKIILKYVLDGTLTKPVLDAEIYNYFISLPPEILAISNDRFTLISDEMATASAQFGNHPSMYSEIERAISEGILTRENISAYSSGRSPIHIIGNIASNKELAEEASSGILTCFFNYPLFQKKNIIMD